MGCYYWGDVTKHLCHEVSVHIALCRRIHLGNLTVLQTGLRPDPVRWWWVSIGSLAFAAEYLWAEL